MKQKLSAKNWILSIGAIISSGAFYFFSTGLTGFRPLIWLAPIPLLWISMRSSRRSTAIMAFCAYVLGGLNLIGYLARLAPLGVVIGSLLIPAFAFAVIVVAYRDAIVHLRHPLSFLAFPVGWTAYEFLLSSVSPHGTAGSIAYTQLDYLPLVQIASFSGLFGITFVMTLVPAGIAAALHSRDTKNSFLILLIVAGVGLGTLTYGWLRLSEPIITKPIHVGLVSIDSTVKYFNTTDRDQALGVLEAYGRSVTELANHGAQIVVLPEKLVGVTERYERDVYAFLSGLARQKNISIVAGLNRIGAEPHRNLAVVFSSDGDVVGEYDKVYPVPGLESGYRTGGKRLQLSIAGAATGIAICKDMDFQSWIRHYGKAGVGILIVPAWDFSSDAWLHSRMAVLRAVENGFALVRAANNGFLTTTDDRGRVIGEATSSNSASISLLSEVSPGGGSTFYAVTGDWFAWLNLLFLLILVVAVSRRLLRRRSTLNL
jgi:apolipoprotein N-acyltransferase